jgi:hypothetical protein
MNSEPCHLVRLTKIESELIHFFRLLQDEHQRAIRLLACSLVSNSHVPERDNVVSLRPRRRRPI